MVLALLREIERVVNQKPDRCPTCGAKLPEGDR